MTFKEFKNALETKTDFRDAVGKMIRAIDKHEIKRLLKEEYEEQKYLDDWADTTPLFKEENPNAVC